MKGKTTIILMTITLMITSVMFIGQVNAETTPQPEVQYNLHDRIVIDIVDDFMLYPEITGDGTEFNPYIIENIEIDGSMEEGSCIYISVDDPVYVIIRDSYLHDSVYGNTPGADPPDDYPSGIAIFGGINLIIDNVVLENHNEMGQESHGIYAENSFLDSTDMNIEVIDCEITTSLKALWIDCYYGGLVEIKNNTIHNNNDISEFTLSIENHIISGNEYYSNAGALIVTGDSIEISNNSFHDNTPFTAFSTGTDDSKICFNTFTNNGIGMYLGVTHNNIIFNNTFQANNYGISIFNSGYDHVFWNRFINNTNQYYTFGMSLPYWWNLTYYEGGGNYWSDYNGTDIYSGVNQDEEGRDYIGDTPYEIGTITDYYPLINISGWVNLTVPAIYDAYSIDDNKTIAFSFYEYMDTESNGTALIDNTTEVNYTWEDSNTLIVDTNGTTENETFTLTVSDFESKSGYEMQEYESIFAIQLPTTYPLEPENELEVQLTVWQVLQPMFIGILALMIIIIFFKKMKEGLEEDFGDV